MIFIISSIRFQLHPITISSLIFYISRHIQYSVFYIFQLQMKQRRNRGKYNQIKSMNREDSCVDVFTKAQSIFLQKFFRYNLSDYFHDIFSNIEEDLLIKRIKNKQIKQLSAETFITKSNICIGEFAEKVSQFYSCKPDQDQELNKSFKFLYSNTQKQGSFDIGQKQLVVVRIKIKADVQKIQNLPNQFFKELQICLNESDVIREAQDEQLFTHFRKYKKAVINMFVIYFGDINFHLFNKKHYSVTKVNFFGREVQIKIFVFYISRISMIETFKRVNKIEQLEYINDLLIQLYEFKRQKIRSRRIKNNKLRQSQFNRDKEQLFLGKILRILKWLTIISISGLTIGALILKCFF